MTRRSHQIPRFARAGSTVLFLFILVGCGASNTSTAPAQTAAPLVASEWGIQGTGNETTDPMELVAGSANVSCTYAGSTEFGIAIIDASGTTVKDLRSPAGSDCAGLSYDLAQSGSYTLRISADGPWEITVTSAGAEGVTETR